MPVRERQIIARCTVNGEPASKARARVVVRNDRARAYTPKATEAAQETVAWEIKIALAGRELSDSDTFGVECHFVSGVLTRRDVDNMLKLVMDAATGVVWHDDYQVSEIHATLERDAPNPRTEVTIFVTGEVTRRQVPCVECGKPVRVYPSAEAKDRFCSRRCHDAARRAGAVRACTNCAKPFYVPATRLDRTRYCSEVCKVAGKTVALTCNYCQRPLRRPQSQARSSKSYCDRRCYAAKRRVEITLTEIA